MYYKKFIINSYKAITRPIEIDLEKNSLIPIIGINECGKTTILNSIFAFDSSNDHYDPTIKQITDVHNLYATLDEPASIAAEINLSLEDYREVVADYFKRKNPESEKPQKRFTFKKPRNCNWPLSIIITREIKNPTSTYHLDKKELLSGIDDESKFCEELVLHLPYILYFDDFRDSFPDRIEIKEEADSHWLEIIEELFKKTAPSYSTYKLAQCEKRQRNNILRDVEDKINASLTKEWANFRLDDREALKINIDFDSEETTEEVILKKPTYPFTEKSSQKVIKSFLSFEVVEKTKEGKERTFYVRDRSKGFYWFFNFVMKLEFNPKKLANDSNTIYLLDEPGSYLHPYAQMKLCKKLVTLSKDNHVLYCTHAPYLLDPEIIPLNTIHIAQKSDSYGIQLQRCNQYNRHDQGLQSAFQPIFDALHIKPFRLDFSYKKMLLVEGIYDFYCFELFRETKNYGIIPGKGADSLTNLISLMIGFDIDFKVLWDNDKAGIDSRNKAITYFGKELAEDHFHLLPKEDTSTKKILQDLFEGSDIHLIKTALQHSPDSSFEKVISSLFFSDRRNEIVKNISSKTKANFANVLKTIGFTS
jgi:predicted ATP-dependent endonuclease of OLD family